MPHLQAQRGRLGSSEEARQELDLVSILCVVLQVVPVVAEAELGTGTSNLRERRPETAGVFVENFAGGDVEILVSQDPLAAAPGHGTRERRGEVGRGGIDTPLPELHVGFLDRRVEYAGGELGIGQQPVVG